MNKKIIFSGGGTGGHIFPAINLMKHFFDKEYKVILVTDNRGNNFIKNYSEFKSYILRAGTPTNKNLFKKFFSYFLIFYSIVRSILILKKERPNLIFGFGGYVSFPISFASRFFNLPLVIYENNMVLGRTNKYLSSFSRKILLAKAESFNGIIASQEIIKEMQAVSIAYRKALKKVEIPYVKNIAESMDTNFDQVLRHFDKILSLIEAHALLHQEDRKKRDGKVVANEQDYSVVCSLLEPILSTYSRKVIDFDTIRIIKAIKEHGEIKGNILDATPDDIDRLDTSNTFLADKLNMSPCVVSSKCKRAKELGLIVNHANNGKSAMYSVLRDPASLDKVLPSWSELM